MKWIKRDGLETVKDVFLRSIAVDAFNGAFVQVDGYLVPGTIVDEFGQVDLTHHGWHDV